MQHNSIQYKIDSFIKDANDKISIAKRNEIGALVSYSQALDLFDFLDKPYSIQYHEINVKISMCWELLGNVKTSLEYLNIAMQTIPNIPTLILYKSVLLQMLGFSEDSQKFLLKFKQLGGKNIQLNFLYDTFRLIFYYVMEYDEDILLREINDYLIKYKEVSNKGVVIYYIRAQMYSMLANKFKKDEVRKSHFIEQYEENIMKANHLSMSDANYLIQENISNENLGKIFLMVMPHMIDFKPKHLVEYKKLCGGLGVFYLIFKAIKLFKIKVDKKKIKNYYINQIKYYQKNASQSNINDNSNSINETKINTHDDNSIKGNNSSLSNNNEKKERIFKNIDEIKKEYQNSLRKLYKSVWVNNPKNSSINPMRNHPNNNYFIEKGYYLNSALKPILLKYIEQEEEYKLISEKEKAKHPRTETETSTKKTPVKLSRSIRMKIKSTMCNNIHSKNKNNSITSNNEISDKSCFLRTHSNKKDEDDSYISHDNTNNKSDTSKKMIHKSSKKEIIAHSASVNEKNSKVSSKEKLIKIANVKHLNLHISSKEKLKTSIKSNIISSYSTKPTLIQYKQKSSLSKYLVNSFTNKTSSKTKHKITHSTSANKSDDTKQVATKKYIPFKKITTNIKTCENS